MPTDVIMPQMGESIFEGTITKWLKKAGDPVEKDEPLFEISTDKVDAEIPSPVAGVLTEIKVPEGATVEVNTVVAVIGEARRGCCRRVKKLTAEAPPRRSCDPSPAAQSAPQALGPTQAAPHPLLAAGAAHCQGERPRPQPNRGHRLGGPHQQGRCAALSEPSTARQRSAKLPHPGAAAAARRRSVPLTKMRAIIAERMVESVKISPHVHTVYKVDMTRVVRLREREKAGFERRHGVKLTLCPSSPPPRWRRCASSPSSTRRSKTASIHYHQNINLGIAVALEWGLIVPVVRQAEERSFLEPGPRHRRPGRARPHQETEAGRGLGVHIHAHQLRRLRRRVQHAHHQPAGVGHPVHQRPQKGGGGADRCRGQRHDCDSVDAALHPGLRPSHSSMAPTPANSCLS